MRAITWLRMLLGGALVFSIAGCADSVSMVPARDQGLSEVGGPRTGLVALIAPPKAAHQQTVWLGTTDMDDVPPPGTMAAPQDDTDPDTDDLQIVSSSLNNKLTVLRIECNRSATNNLLAVMAGLRNQTGHRLRLEVQTLYQDKDGRALNSPMSWIPLTLKPHEETQYRSEAISEDAAHFIVRVRHAGETEEASR